MFAPVPCTRTTGSGWAAVGRHGTFAPGGGGVAADAVAPGTASAAVHATATASNLLMTDNVPAGPAGKPDVPRARVARASGGKRRDVIPVRSSTVDGVLRRSANRHPDRTALRFADRSWTYRELDDAVSRAARTLLDLGLERGDRVAAYGKNSDAYLLGYLGCARAGLVHVPINYALLDEELAYLL